MIIWGLLSLALAGEPTSYVASTGGIVGTVSLPAAPDRVLAFVSDPVIVNKTTGGGTTVKVVEKQGACMVLDYLSPSVITDVHYRVRQCPVAGGVESTLIESDAFSNYRARFTVTPEGTGALLRYDVDMTVTLWVPKSLVEQTTKREVRKMMEHFLAHFTAPS